MAELIESHVSVDIVGGDGRAHIVGQVLAEDDAIDALHYFGGNAGTGRMNKSTNLDHNADDTDAIIEHAEAERSLVFISSENQIIKNELAAKLREYGVLVFGPSDGRLEGSKAWAVRLMKDERVPCPETWEVGTHAEADLTFEEAEDFVRQRGSRNLVLKADGLAGGKGATLNDDDGAAIQEMREMRAGKYDGAGKERFIIQVREQGPEATFTYVFDGENWVSLPSVQDNKRALEGDKGENTGGMGAAGPVTGGAFTSEVQAQADEAMDRTAYGLRKRCIDYRGAVALGTMLTPEGLKILEYSIRFNDPESQVMFTLLKKAGVDVHQLLRRTAEGTLGANYTIPEIVGMAAVSFALTEAGYPDKSKMTYGHAIHGLDGEYPNVTIQHAGTKIDNDTGQIVTSGGRVLYVTGEDETIDQAADREPWRPLARMGSVLQRCTIGGTLATNYGLPPSSSC